MNLDDQQDEVRSGKGKRESGDVTQRVGRDPRVSRLIDWVWAALGSLVVGAILYTGSQIGGLRDAVADTNLQVALSRQQTAAILDELKDHETRLRSNEGDIRDVKTRMGMNMRGEPEVHHGR